jgi:hypothetical protein
MTESDARALETELFEALESMMSDRPLVEVTFEQLMSGNPAQ